MKILIVGANRGLGYVLAKMSSQYGFSTIAGVVGEHYHEDLLDLDNTNVVQTDVTDNDQLAQAAKNLRSSQLDVIINVAGTLLPDDREHTILQIMPDTIQKSFEVNAIGNINLARNFLPLLKKGGRYLTVTSEAGMASNSGSVFPAYSISKAAANKIVYVLKATYGQDYYFFAIHPGRMDTEMGHATANMKPEESSKGILEIATKTFPDIKQTFIDYAGREMLI